MNASRLSPSRFALVAGLAAACVLLPAQAAVAPGDSAPDFSAPAEMRGHEFAMSLSDALQRGPVVLIFASAPVVAECGDKPSPLIAAADRYRDFNATVLGVGRGATPGAMAHCASPIPMAVDPDDTIASAYGVSGTAPQQLAAYVIAPDGTVLHRETPAIDDAQAPQRTVDVLRDWVARAKPNA